MENNFPLIGLGIILAFNLSTILLTWLALQKRATVEDVENLEVDIGALKRKIRKLEDELTAVKAQRDLLIEEKRQRDLEK